MTKVRRSSDGRQRAHSPRSIKRPKGPVKTTGDLNLLYSNLVTDLDSFACTDEKRSAAMERLRLRMRKRANFSIKELEMPALQRFLVVNDEVGAWQPGDLFRTELFGEAKLFIEHALQRYTSRVSLDETFGSCLAWNELLNNWRLGPKASHGVKGTGTVEKLEQPWTCTIGAEPLVKRITMGNPYLSALNASSNGHTRVIRGSKLTSVPKNEDTVRIIATEPSGNMALQLAGGRYLEDCLRMIGLDITCQEPRNKAFARVGSVTGRFATLDLKEASDRMSLKMIEALWPPEWVNFFKRVRSPSCRIPGLNLDKVDLNMVSTMGNGTTFPMMTFTILAIIYATRRIHHSGPKLWVDWGCTAVYGDDIVVKTDEVETVVQALQSFGFVVNTDKSYWTGPFRESCGGDYYDGYDITPVYVRSIETPAECYVVINQLLSWAGKHSVPLVRSVRYVKSLLSKVYIVPEWLNPDNGVKLAECPTKYKFLQPNPVLRVYRGQLSLMLAVGGYLGQRDPPAEDEDGDLTYNPHESWVSYRTREATLPEGYVDGWDPAYGSILESAYRSLIWSLA